MAKASWQRDLVGELDSLTATKLDAGTAAFLCAAENIPEAGEGDVSREGSREAFGVGLWLNLTKNPRTKVRGPLAAWPNTHPDPMLIVSFIIASAQTFT